jgi:hypothetical protein
LGNFIGHPVESYVWVFGARAIPLRRQERVNRDSIPSRHPVTEMPYRLGQLTGAHQAVELVPRAADVGAHRSW